jgi:predicted nucleic acid-binding protein
MISTKKMLGIGVLAIVTGSVIYVLSGEHGKQNRKKLAAWMKKMEERGLAKLKEVKEINEEKYSEFLNKAKVKYQALRDFDPEEVAIMALQLKKNWPKIKASLKSDMSKGGTPAKPKQKVKASKKEAK